MNTASPKLCKELYELSGWYSGYTFRDYPGRIAQEYYDIPMYDCGYLLRKLPKEYNWYNTTQLFRLVPCIDGTWLAKYADTGHKHCHVDTNSQLPEDALCKLAIELFNKGVLEK